MTAGAIDVTPPESPVRSFVAGGLITPDEARELGYLTAADDVDARIIASVLGPPALSFLPARALTPEEEAEFRRDWENLDARAAASLPGPPVLAGMTAPVTAVSPPVRDEDAFGTHRGQCQGCKLDDSVDIWGRCLYCAELAALRERNLPGPPLAWWWYLVPSVLGLCLGLIATWAVLYAIFYVL